MAQAVEIETTVLPGHTVQVEVQTPELAVGSRVRVLVQAAPLPADGVGQQSILEFIASLPEDVRVFRTGAEVTAYLDEERDSWDR